MNLLIRMINQIIFLLNFFDNILLIIFVANLVYIIYIYKLEGSAKYNGLSPYFFISLLLYLAINRLPSNVYFTQKD